MTREQAITEAADVFAAACVQSDALPADEVARRAYVPGDPYTIAELVEIVRQQRADARAAVPSGEAA